MLHYWWVPVVLAMYSIYAYYAKTANENPTSMYPLVMLYGIQCIGLWPIIARYSQNLFFDGLLFDTIMLFSYCGTLIALGAAAGFNILQWVGVLAVVVGLSLIKACGG